MNKDRRRQLQRTAPMIRQAMDLLAEARAAIASVRDEEQDVHDNLSEGQQAGDQGDAMQSAIASMEQALDGIDALDVRPVAEAIEAATGEDAGIDGESPKLDASQVEERRMARLPDWARKRMDRLEAERISVEDRMAGMFGEATGAPEEIVIGDYSSPIEGRLIPARAVVFPAFGITVTVERGRGGRGITISGQRSLCVHPNVSNSIVVSAEKY